MWTSENRYAYERKAQRYPSDLTDEEWALVEPHLPPPRQRSRHKSPERRDVLDAILYVLTTGCQWRALPKDFPLDDLATFKNLMVWFACETLAFEMVE